MAPVSGAEIVFLTALGLEYDALHAQLTDPSTHFDADGTRYAVGTLDGGCRVALALIGEGNLAAAALTGRAIQEFSPAALLFVGVAGALNDDAAVGDVVVATRVHAYHGGREESGGFRPRPRGWPIGHGIEQIARAVAQAGDWTGALPDSGGRPPRVHFKSIVSGDVVLDSRTSPLAGFIAEQYSDAIAIDMESAGVAEGAHRKNFHNAVTIRGISDAADGAKRQRDAAGWQPRAATNAAAFAAALAHAISRSSLSAPPPGDDPTAGRRTPDSRTPDSRTDRAVRPAENGGSRATDGSSPPDRSRAGGAIRMILHRLGTSIRGGGWPVQVLSAILVAAVLSLVYLGVAAIAGALGDADPAEPGATARTAPAAADRADPASWVVAGTGHDVVLPDWRTIDLETMTMGDFDMDGNNLPGTDLGLTHDGTRLYGWTAVLDASGEHDVARCLDAERYIDSIHSNLRAILTLGRDVCVRTEEENLAMLTVDGPPSGAFPKLTFHYTVWQLR
nr:5'-methylthioadenosine/S-adenosylhomocysteine nucleosidase [Micromonospora sp. DSM 115978]